MKITDAFIVIAGYTNMTSISVGNRVQKGLLASIEGIGRRGYGFKTLKKGTSSMYFCLLRPCHKSVLLVCEIHNFTGCFYHVGILAGYIMYGWLCNEQTTWTIS